MEAGIRLSARSVAKHKSSPVEVDEGRAVLVKDTLHLLGMVIVLVGEMIQIISYLTLLTVIFISSSVPPYRVASTVMVSLWHFSRHCA